MAAKALLPTLVLDIGNLNEMIKILKHFKFPESKWFEFGLELGLLHPTLKSIEVNYSSVGRALMECLTKWLNKADKVVGPLTWRTFGRALIGIDERAVGEGIIKIMANPASQILQRYSCKLSQVVLTNETVQLLHTEGVITEDTATELEMSGCKIVDDSLIAVYTMVAEDYNKLRILADILMNIDDAVSLANGIAQEYESKFVSANTTSSLVTRKQISTVRPIDEIDLISTSTTNTTTQGSGSVVISIQRDEQPEFERMRYHLGSLLDTIASIFETRIPSIEKLKTFLRRCLPEMKPRLKLAETFDDVMEIIEEKCSIINIVIVEAIVRHFSIEAAQSHITAYEEKVEEFCKRENSLRICNNVQLKTLSTSHLTCETIKFTLNWEIDEHTLNDIRDLLTKSFSSMAKRVEVVVIKEGNSITVTCYAPHYLMESLLVIARGNLDLLKEMGLTILIIGYYTVYDETHERAIYEEVKSLDKRLKLAEEERDYFKDQLYLKEEDVTSQSIENVSILKKTKETQTTDESLQILLPDESSTTEQKDQLQTYKRIIGSMSLEKEVLLKSKEGVQEDLVESRKEIALLQERISSIHQQLLSQNTSSMSLEIERLKSTLNTKEGLEESLMESKKEVTLLQEKISSLNAQLLSEETKKYQSTQSIQSEELSTDKPTMLEHVELFKLAMTDTRVADIPMINDIRDNPASIYDKTSLFFQLINDNPFLLTELRDVMKGEERTNGKVYWSDDEVELVTPSPLQCHEVITQLKDDHKSIQLLNSSIQIVNLLIPPLLKRQTIEDITIHDTKLTPDCIFGFSLSTNTSLKTLHFRLYSVDDSVVSALTQSLHDNTTLTGLSLSSNPSITDASITPLSNLLRANSTLSYLSLWGTSISSSGVRLFLDAFKSSEVLKVLRIDKKHEVICSYYVDYELVKDRLYFI